MADLRSVSPAAFGQAALGMDNCPHVADLITYALGLASSADRLRVERHLQQNGGCPCHGWIEKTIRFRAEPWPNNSPPLSPLPSVAEQTPIPPSSKWQRSAFRDLEERLRLLDEHQR